MKLNNINIKSSIRTALMLIACTFAAVSFSSCDDYLTLYPEDGIVDDEYWNNGDEVQSVVYACYSKLSSSNVLYRMIYWGELRSDNETTNSVSTDESNLWNANLLSSNSLVKWNDFYSCINYCNNVLKKAPGVQSVDPNFTDATFHAYMAEAYTIRAFCYFYLVRAFGDVPYITEPSDSEQKDYMVYQSPQDSIIDCLISDLETYSIQWAPSDWETVEDTHGRITLNAVRALLADIYLWKASDSENSNATADYQKCVDLCNAILNDNSSTLVFEQQEDMYDNVFGEGNSTENIFELNYSSDWKNTVTRALYGNTATSTTAHFNPTQNLYNQFGEYDTRCYQYMALNGSTQNGEYTVTSYRIFKYEGRQASSDWGQGYTYRSSSSYANWIIYRLADVYLMKAEALAVMAVTTSNQSQADEALKMCNIIYERANQENESLTADLSNIEDVVMEERRREFCFEGKRWFDLLRMVRRNGNTEKAVQLVAASRSGDTSLLEARLSTIDSWYLPISKSEMNANPHLVQNDYYSQKEY